MASMGAAVTVRDVMKDVYGDWTAEGWAPKPLPSGEAGDHPSGQRRYLWVDAFGVLNFVALAEQAGEAEEARRLLQAAAGLIQAVHECLGTPRGPEFPMRAAADGGFEGLRIGKERARADSDPGMAFDGMYWHYLDKWIFALARYGRAAGDAAAVAKGLRLVRQVHPCFLARSPSGEPLGLYWKMNVDLSTIPGRERAGPNGDAVSALVAYTALERARESVGPSGDGGLGSEIADLKAVVRRYAGAGGFETGSSDPLGFGLQFWEAQFYPEQLASTLRQALTPLAGSALDARHFSLPFRLYGGLLGAQLSGNERLTAAAEELLGSLAPIEMRKRCGEEEHSGINKVMLASSLMPGAWKRRGDEAPIDL